MHCSTVGWMDGWMNGWRKGRWITTAVFPLGLHFPLQFYPAKLVCAVSLSLYTNFPFTLCFDQSIRIKRTTLSAYACVCVCVCECECERVLSTPASALPSSWHQAVVQSTLAAQTAQTCRARRECFHIHIYTHLVIHGEPPPPNNKVKDWKTQDNVAIRCCRN